LSETITACQNYDLSKETTFKVGGISSCVYLPESLDELSNLLETLDNPVVLGAGSNTIISSEGVNFPIILTKKLNKFEFKDNFLTAQCGAKTALLSQKAFEKGLSGFEFLTCIPASIGGVVFMNASAHKQWVSDVIVSAKVFDLSSKKILELSKDELGLGYRNSILQHKNYILLEAKFELKASPKNLIQQRMDENKAYRNKNHPSMKIPNAGSIFRNPEGEVAGRLIDGAGLKGAFVGGAKVSEIHANFIVNTENATSFDILSLMFLIQEEVQKKYGYKLRPEVKYIGNSEKEDILWQKLNS
jgi:UDP-N-acetylmuramate dehydrogenase